MSNPETTVKKSVVVNAPLARAFQVFTERFDTWWPRTHHIGKVEPYTAILEGRAGGRWYERGADGSECDWGRVLVYSPPTRVAVSWHLDATYQYDPDPSKASRVEVTFHDENGRTRVELVHSSSIVTAQDGRRSARASVRPAGGAASWRSMRRRGLSAMRPLQRRRRRKCPRRRSLRTCRKGDDVPRPVSTETLPPRPRNTTRRKVRGCSLRPAGGNG